VDPVINAKVKAYWTQIATPLRATTTICSLPRRMNQREQYCGRGHVDVLLPDLRQRGPRVGGNNTNRWLVLQSISDPTWMNALPTDTVSNRLMVEYHDYTPSLFTIIHSDQSWARRSTFGARPTIIPGTQLATHLG